MDLHLIISNSQEKLNKIGPPFDTLLKTHLDELNELYYCPGITEEKKMLTFPFFFRFIHHINHLFFFFNKDSTCHSKTAQVTHISPIYPIYLSLAI